MGYFVFVLLAVWLVITVCAIFIRGALSFLEYLFLTQALIALFFLVPVNFFGGPEILSGTNEQFVALVAESIIAALLIFKFIASDPIGKFLDGTGRDDD